MKLCLSKLRNAKQLEPFQSIIVFCNFTSCNYWTMLNGSMCFHLETHIWITAFHFDPFIQDVSDSSEILHGDVQVTLIHHRIPSLVHSCGLHASQDRQKTLRSLKPSHRITGACWSCTKRVPRNIPKVAIVEACHTRLHWIQHLILWTVGPKRCPRLDVRMDVKCKKHQGHPTAELPTAWRQALSLPPSVRFLQIFWFCKDQRGG